jgi:hydrogenase maturation protein HypF
VARVWRGAEYPIRRSRGYAPAPVKLRSPAPVPILACGAELKNTFCLTRGAYAFLSHHIGDLDNLETLTSFEEGIRHFEKLFHISPEAIVYDLHPEYLSTKYALERADVEKKIGVQHHHAHIAACLADNGKEAPVIGVSMDGLGYGPDGVLWGGEWLVCSMSGFIRAAFMSPLPMPGGALAIKQPWRMAAAALKRLCGRDLKDNYLKDLLNKTDEQLEIAAAAIERRINCPETTSMGRLFDAVSALLTGRSEINYEGQAAVELELAASDNYEGVYPFGMENTGESPYSWGAPLAVVTPGPALRVNFAETIEGIIRDVKSGADRAVIASKFHSTVAAAIVGVCVEIRRNCGIATAALSGGVFQNMRLLEESVSGLERAGFRVLTHRRVPTNDGGLSLGQTAIAAELLKSF